MLLGYFHTVGHVMWLGRCWMMHVGKLGPMKGGSEERVLVCTCHLLLAIL